MAEEYSKILCVGPGLVQASVIADNYFPVIGETSKMEATTKWALSAEWQTQDGSGSTETEAATLSLQKASKSVTVLTDGELPQKFTAVNRLSSVEVQKMLYAMQAQALPYFDIDYDTTKQVIRSGSDNGIINLKTENGYAKDLTDSTQVTVEIRIYKENETTDPVITKSYANDDTFTLTARGIYDVEVDVTDIESGITLSKRINKLITVTPALCPKPADTTTGYEVVTTYNGSGEWQRELKLWRDVDGTGLNYAEFIMPKGVEGSSYYATVDISGLPAGTTMCLKDDPAEEGSYCRRLLVCGNNPSSVSAENGTPNWTYDAPLVITHDCETTFEWGWRYYGAMQFNANMRNVVIDGYGYHNTGMHLYPFNENWFVDSCIFINGGSSLFELFGIDVDGAGFAGISAKTDPGVDAPWFWRGNGFEMYLNIHHCTFRNTVGEGIYLGYFATDEKTGTNSSGEEVSYYAHLMRDLRIYRCEFSQNGYDSVQINNAVGVEFCYNKLSGCGYLREPSQGSAFSCTMDGKIYNCTIENNYNIFGVIGPFLSSLEIFNCVITTARTESAWTLTAWSGTLGVTEITDKTYSIHNNVVKAGRIATLNGDVTMSNFSMNDNIFITEDGNTATPGYFTGSGNIFIQADQDYAAIDTALKVADSENYEYQPAYNAPSVTAGENGLSPFDMRGYKNWYSSTFHAGPYMGKYKDTSVDDSSLKLEAITINSGDTNTVFQTVSVNFTYKGVPTLYRIGESSDLSDVEWSAWTGDTVDYTLSDGYGTKTIYAQLAMDGYETAAVSGSIVYSSSITFADAEVLRVLCETQVYKDWVSESDYGSKAVIDTNGDGVITNAEAAAVKSLTTYYLNTNSAFENNTVIETFNELKYFTGLVRISTSMFKGCTNLREVTLPSGPTEIGTYPIQGTAITHWIVPEGYTTFSTISGSYGTTLEVVDYPSTATTMNDTFMWNNDCNVFICRVATPPTFASWGRGTVGAVYVPDDSVDAYKAATTWSEKADIIYPLSEYVES
ncbi:MAG: leucine-rich repeat protein [Bacteroides sp.]|nr:leucine-rich repeat protein [Bacteroides sp.]